MLGTGVGAGAESHWASLEGSLEQVAQSSPNPRAFTRLHSRPALHLGEGKKLFRRRIPGDYSERGQSQGDVDSVLTALYYFRFTEEEFEAYNDAAKNQPQVPLSPEPCSLSLCYTVLDLGLPLV